MPLWWFVLFSCRSSCLSTCIHETGYRVQTKILIHNYAYKYETYNVIILITFISHFITESHVRINLKLVMCISTYLHIYTYYQLSPQVETHVINTIGYEHFNIVGYEPFNTVGYESSWYQTQSLI